MVGPKKQDFWPWPRIIIHTPRENSLNFLRGVSVYQKLGIILEKKVVQKLNLEKNVFTKKWSPKLIFLNDFFWKKLVDFFTQKIDFESTILPLFDKP